MALLSPRTLGLCASWFIDREQAVEAPVTGYAALIASLRTVLGEGSNAELVGAACAYFSALECQHTFIIECITESGFHTT